MLVRILKPFPYSGDGFRSRLLATGEVVDVHDRFVPGLMAEWFVGDGPAGDLPEASDDAPSASGEDTAPACEPETMIGIRKRKGKFGRFDVLDANGNKVNDKMLSEADADAMVASLAAGG